MSTPKSKAVGKVECGWKLIKGGYCTQIVKFGAESSKCPNAANHLPIEDLADSDDGNDVMPAIQITCKPKKASS